MTIKNKNKDDHLILREQIKKKRIMENLLAIAAGDEVDRDKNGAKCKPSVRDQLTAIKTLLDYQQNITPKSLTGTMYGEDVQVTFVNSIAINDLEKTFKIVDLEAGTDININSETTLEESLKKLADRGIVI